ncbi:amino acid adenylation domain-containing protein [Lentzea sp. HUAS12]|uniref:non-ribosomal peptide synthetase n=1 Tax=Lentzea sp. HUAS12 TaxID=2951806 RepID=UPI0020A07919|nr:amino acid adenylation domain-containing protein [Lentzea sp. HUAS12]USX53958.1 amino acid adenylation domain-containing protein [Lentzea sp. HUAS12]
MSVVRADTAIPLDEVVEAVAETLDVPPASVGVDTPLIALGLESFTAVRLRRHLLDTTGVALALTDFLGQATARTVAAALNAQDEDAGGPSADEPSDESFPLTPIQTAYWVGRDPGFPLGGVATFYYREFEHDTPVGHDEAARLGTAWNALVRRHSALRMVVDDDATGRVLATVPHHEIPVTDLRDLPPDEAARVAAELREKWSHQTRPTGCWPLFDLNLVLLPGQRSRVCVGVDVLSLDLAGWMQVMGEWGALVADPDTPLPEPGTTFAEVARRRAAQRLGPDDDRARRYWADRALPPGPALPTVTDVASVRRHRFTRTATELDAERWAALRRAASDHGVSPTALLLAACGLTLARWSPVADFCLNTTLFDRPDDPELAHVVGDFTSTMLVRMPVWEARDGFAAYARAVNEQFWSDMDHREAGGTQAVRSGGSAIGAPPHPVVFTSGLGLTTGDADPAAWLGSEVYGISQTPQVLLDHIVHEEAGRLRVWWDGVDGVYPEGLVAGMADAHLRLLTALAGEPDSWEDPSLGWTPSFRPDVPLDVAPFADAGPLLDDPLRAAADLDPGAPALLDSRSSLSHGELARDADAIGRRLAASGVGPGDLVAVSSPKSIDQVVALLGVAASGAGYVPVEPSWPVERVASVCAQAGIEHALVTGDVPPIWPETVRVHRLDAADGGSTAPVRPSPEELAYVIFTSGSTGRPKGVAIEHRAARTTIDDLVDRFPITRDDRMLALSAFSFDLSVHDVFGVLGVGGALVVPDAERQRDPEHWLDLMDRHGVTLWNTAPALLEMLVEYAEIDPALARRALRALRLVFLSGDWIPVTLPDRLRELAPQAQVVSLGGATEASIWSICHPIGEVDPEWPSIPYGSALRGQSFHVLDEEGLPVPVGVPGELHIGGDGLARGYVGDAEQTAQRFAVHPVLGHRLYRTGDLGRWRLDGTIEFLGRADRQVKVRGHRIELGEVESVLDRAAGVRKSVAAVVPGPDDRPRLIAFVVPADPAAPPAAPDLSAHLLTRVPQYMVPSRFTFLPELPITANGKVDHTALPNPYRRDETPAAVPEQSAVDDREPLWLTEAVARAAELGLEVSLTVGPGAHTPSDALAAAAQWSRATATAAAALGVELRESLNADGLLRLTVPAAPARQRPVAPRTGVTAPPVAAEAAAQAVTAGMAAPACPELEETVLAVFRSVLGPHADATTSFFELGATSLTLVLAYRKLTAQGFATLTVVDLFANPTVRALAAFLAPAGAPEPVPDPVAAVPRPQGRRDARRRAEQVAR